VTTEEQLQIRAKRQDVVFAAINSLRPDVPWPQKCTGPDRSHYSSDGNYQVDREAWEDHRERCDRCHSCEDAKNQQLLADDEFLIRKSRLVFELLRGRIGPQGLQGPVGPAR
jgi:hypothetical protein